MKLPPEIKRKKTVPVYQLEYQFSELYSAHSRPIDSILDTVPTVLLRGLCSDAATGKLLSEQYSSAWTGTQQKPEIQGQGSYEVRSNFHILLCPSPYETPSKRSGKNCQQLLFLYLTYDIWMNN